MNRQFSPLAVLVSLFWMLAVGCQPQQPFYFHDSGDLSHYVGVATNIEYPDVDIPSLGEVGGALPPLTLDNQKPREMWDLPLQEAVRFALDNSKVIRTLNTVNFGASGAFGDPTFLLSQPGIVTTVFDPARAESDPRFGVEGVLSAFDAQFNTSVTWEKNRTPTNSTLFNGVVGERVGTLKQDLGTFQAQLAKTAVSGGTFTLTENINFEANNNPANVFPSVWSTSTVAQFSQPLLQGAGVQFNRIAGPGAVPGFYNGVMIARLRTDVALTEFEGSVRDLVRDVERAYWELYYAYRRLDTAIVGRDSALQTWRQVYAKFVVGGKGGAAQDEAQARQQYYVFRTAVEQALSNLYRTENNLRYIMGLAATDGRLIRPADEPTTAKVSFDWYEIHAEALTRSVELRQQKWVVKQRELELMAAKNFLLPRLDAVGQYIWSGMGDELIDPSDNRNNAFGSLVSGDFQGWQLGLQMNLPIGFRREMAGVRNAQLNLARDRSVAQEQELELSHQMASAIRELSDNYVLTATNFNRRVAAKNEVDAIQAAYDQGVVTLDLVLLAQQRLAEAEIGYYRSLIDYNESIANVHYRKGSLLEYDGVYLAEGPWPGKAYFDALRLARSRGASHYLNYGFTRPKVISRGPINQNPPSPGISSEGVVPEANQPETVPAPAPESRPGTEPTLQPSPQPQADQQTAIPSGGAGLVDVLAIRPGSAEGGIRATRSELQPVSYQQPVSNAQSVVSTGWRSTATASRQEPVASSTAANVGGAASGWKRVER